MDVVCVLILCVCKNYSLKITLLWTSKEKIYVCVLYRTKLTLKFCSGLTIRTFPTRISLDDVAPRNVKIPMFPIRSFKVLVPGTSSLSLSVLHCCLVVVVGTIRII